MIKATVGIVLSVFCLSAPAAFAEEALPGGEEAAVRAYFLGYENDDLIFRIVNESASPISIKGLSFNQQILYRPTEKDSIVPVSAQESPYKDIHFRPMGDFVWSENHMDRFQLAYQWPQIDERMYGKIYPKFSSLVSEKELVTETVP